MSHDHHAAAVALLRAQTEHAVRHTAVRAFAQLAGGDRCELLQPVDGRLESRASVVFGPDAASAPGPLETHRGIVEHAYRHGTAGLVDDLSDVRAARSGDAGATDGGHRSLLCVPVADHGVLVATDPDPGAFRDRDLDSLRRLAALVAAALDRVTGADGQEQSRREAVATVLSHDVRNLIGVASGRLELAMEGDYHEQLDEVATAHRRLLDLTDDLVALLRTGERVTELESVALAEEARRAWSTVDAPAAGLSVDTEARIMADVSGLCQLLENLFRNAVDHAGPDVTVEVGLRDDEAGFYVADDGPGIPPRDRDAVFELGYTTGEEHTGYGLAIARGIVDAHGWQIRAGESEAGGARFDVTGVDVLEVSPRRPT